MSVAAVDDTLSHAWFSQVNSAVEVAAPGVSVLSAYLGGYAYMDGTSMATPHVSGVAALLFAASPTSTNVDIRAALTGSALDLHSSGRDDYTGYGLVQADDALAFLGGSSCIPSTEDCTNGIDDDCDGLTDAADDECAATCIPVTEDCTNGIDDDCDGLADAADDECAPTCIPVTEDCTNGVDDDCDGLTDSADADCDTGTSDTTAPVISNVNSARQGKNFTITWSTDEASDSQVDFTCCGAFTDGAMTTSHSMGFNGSRHATYEYWVTSADAAGNVATEGPFIHQN